MYTINIRVSHMSANPTQYAIIPTPNDKKSAEIARKIDTLLKCKPSNIQEILTDIKTDLANLLEDNPHFTPEKYNPYQQFLYQQILRANRHGYLHEVVESPQTMPADVVKTNQESVFTDVVRQGDHFIYSADRKAYGDRFSEFCDHSDPQQEQTEAALFIKFYDKANKKIGAQTQFSNYIKGVGKRIGTLFSEQLTRKSHGQRREEFHRHNKNRHSDWRGQFEIAIQLVEQGQPLEDIHCRALDLPGFGGNPYYAVTHFNNEEEPRQISHIGHASTLLRFGEFCFVADPLHYQSGTGGKGDPSLLSVGASIAYPRQTIPAFTTSRYPGGQIVWISHNHHDHLCPKTIKESFAPDTLFVVPAGDGEKLRTWGFENVIDIESWNDVVEINHNGEQLKIHALPAKHASNRGLSDYMESLFMGCIVEHTDKAGNTIRHLITGDTGVLSKEHYQQLETWVINNGPLDSASIASGPDRPRSLMTCTHQSTADALVYHARLSVANYKHHLNESGKDALSFEEFNGMATKGMAYHQGCYRLGLLAYSDVLTTITRMMAFLDSFPNDYPINGIVYPEGSNYFHWDNLDDFEKEGFKDLLAVYKSIHVTDASGQEQMLTVGEVLQTIQTNFHIPKIGGTTNLNLDVPNAGVEMDLNNLIVNLPAKNRINLFLNTKYQDQAPASNLYEMLERYYLAFKTISHSSGKAERFLNLLENEAFRSQASQIWFDDAFNGANYQVALQLLGQLAVEVQGTMTHDDDIREEGNFQTLSVMVAKHCHDHLKLCQLSLDAGSEKEEMEGNWEDDFEFIEMPVVPKF